MSVRTKGLQLETRNTNYRWVWYKLEKNLLKLKETDWNLRMWLWALTSFHQLLLTHLWPVVFSLLGWREVAVWERSGFRGRVGSEGAQLERERASERERDRRMETCMYIYRYTVRGFPNRTRSGEADQKKKKKNKEWRSVLKDLKRI